MLCWVSLSILLCWLVLYYTTTSYSEGTTYYTVVWKQGERESEETWTIFYNVHILEGLSTVYCCVLLRVYTVDSNLV